MKTKFVSLNPWKDTGHESFDDELRELQAMLETNIQLKSPIMPRWMRVVSPLTTSDFNLENLLSNDKSTEPEKIFQKLLSEKPIENYCSKLIAALKKSVRDRIAATPAICRICLTVGKGLGQCEHAKIGILFSGGIDCTILACLTDQAVDTHLPIDLINVSFEKINRSTTKRPIDIDYKTPDRLSALSSLEEIRRLSPQRQWNLIEVDVTRQELNEMLRRRISHLVYPLTSVLDESLGAVLWFGSNADGMLSGKPYKSSSRVSEIYSLFSFNSIPTSFYVFHRCY